MTLPTEVIIHIAGILERLGITYHVGGSFASSAHGMYRASADVDIVIDAGLEQLEDLARALEPQFYVSRPAIAEAHAQPGTFNAIHGATSFMKGQLDAAHLDRWAPELGVADLLARARREIADL